MQIDRGNTNNYLSPINNFRGEVVERTGRRKIKTIYEQQPYARENVHPPRTTLPLIYQSSRICRALPAEKGRRRVEDSSLLGDGGIEDGTTYHVWPRWTPRFPFRPAYIRTLPTVHFFPSSPDPLVIGELLLDASTRLASSYF